MDVLADNFGQPGFHELVVAVHDLDARRDLVGGVLTASSRAAFEVRPQGPGPREAEIVDFTGPQRDLLMSFLAGAFRLPVVSPPADVEFPGDSYWRGERHRVCDRPELVLRLIDEFAGIGVEQLILVSPAPPPAVPHGLRAQPLDLRGRVASSSDWSSRPLWSMRLRSRAHAAAASSAIRPDYNPIGPFDFGGVYDEASDRRLTLAALIEQGRVDGYRHVVEPAVEAEEGA